MKSSAPPKLHTKRQKTSGKELTKWKNRDMKLPAVVPQHIMRPVGENSQMLITEEGCIVRGFAPFNVKSWKDVKEPAKEKLLDELRVCRYYIHYFKH